MNQKPPLYGGFPFLILNFNNIKRVQLSIYFYSYFCKNSYRISEMRRIFLIGYMGAGKTTIGRELAKELNLDFIDLDHFIQARFQKTVNQLFQDAGEDEFRNIEKNILREVGDFENVLISAGGGTPCFFDNMEYMNNAGCTIYLKTSAEILASRLNLCKDKRPLVKDKNEEELYNFVVDTLYKRDPFYSKAKIVFETGNIETKEDINTLVQQLIEKL